MLLVMLDRILVVGATLLCHAARPAGQASTR
jgi:hypothetical protein